MRLFLFFFSFFICFSAQADEFNRQWLALVHYQSSMFGGYKSSLDSINFFLSENGKTSPEAELLATIDLFNSKDDERKCFFPARYKFLKAKGLVKTKFPKCAEYEKFVEDLSPAGVTLLFTDAYMNNPSSLFGHTLFRIDTKRKGTQLLAHGANYGAFTGDDGGMMFAVKGLAGGYFGGFTVKPYYDVINMYNNIENRDIWEMRLNFSDDELDMFVAHLWEVGHSQARYFFFTKNCSYLLLEMIDAVRPDAALAEKFPVHAIPLDTFKATAEAGLLKDMKYRPSRQAKIINQRRQMSFAQTGALSKIIKKDEYDMEALSETEQAQVIDTAYQYVQYQNVEKMISREDYRQKSFELLKRRNSLPQGDAFKPLEKGESPLDTHSSMRATVGLGFRNGEAFEEISYRPAYHSLTDNNYGYLKGAEINFLNLVARHYDSQDKYVLERLDLVGIKSLSPANEMFFPFSYNINAGIKREFDPKDEDGVYALDLQLGSGLTYELTESFWAYLMVNNRAQYGGGEMPHNGWLGIGPVIGAYVNIGDFKLLAEMEKTFATDKFGSRMRYKLESAYSISKNQSLAFEYLYEHNYGKNLSEPMVSFRQNF